MGIMVGGQWEAEAGQRRRCNAVMQDKSPEDGESRAEAGNIDLS